MRKNRWEMISSFSQRMRSFICRPLSALKGQFAGEAAYNQMLQAGDPVVYEVYEVHRPPVAGVLPHGLSTDFEFEYHHGQRPSGLACH